MVEKKQVIAVMGATGAQGGSVVRALLEEGHGSSFVPRAITRKPGSERAGTLMDLEVEVVQADADDPASLERAFAGAHGVYAVTNYWEGMSVDREQAQARNIALATRKADVKHVVWSTLEDTRLRFPLSDPRLPTIQGRYKVPHFDSKGQMDPFFAREAAPTSYLMCAFYWENFLRAGQGPQREDGEYVLSLPLHGAKLPGIAVEDIGHCAVGVFRRGTRAIGKHFGIAGDQLTGEEYAEAFSRALGKKVVFRDVPFDTFRSLGFPGAEDMGNMFQHHSILGPDFLEARSVETACELYPDVMSFEDWLSKNMAFVPEVG